MRDKLRSVRSHATGDSQGPRPVLSRFAAARTAVACREFVGERWLPPAIAGGNIEISRVPRLSGAVRYIFRASNCQEKIAYSRSITYTVPRRRPHSVDEKTMESGFCITATFRGFETKQNASATSAPTSGGEDGRAPDSPRGRYKKLRAAEFLRPSLVSEMRFELTQPFGHYPLKVACLPISPPGRIFTVETRTERKMR